MKDEKKDDDSYLKKRTEVLTLQKIRLFHLCFGLQAWFDGFFVL
jgi:hypothetical protein